MAGALGAAAAPAAGSPSGAAEEPRARTLAARVDALLAAGLDDGEGDGDGEVDLEPDRAVARSDGAVAAAAEGPAEARGGASDGLDRRMGLASLEGRGPGPAAVSDLDRAGSGLGRADPADLASLRGAGPALAAREDAESLDVELDLEPSEHGAPPPSGRATAPVIERVRALDEPEPAASPGAAAAPPAPRGADERGAGTDSAELEVGDATDVATIEITSHRPPRLDLDEVIVAAPPARAPSRAASEPVEIVDDADLEESLEDDEPGAAPAPAIPAPRRALAPTPVRGLAAPPPPMPVPPRRPVVVVPPPRAPSALQTHPGIGAARVPPVVPRPGAPRPPGAVAPPVSIPPAVSPSSAPARGGGGDPEAGGAPAPVAPSRATDHGLGGPPAATLLSPLAGLDVSALDDRAGLELDLGGPELGADLSAGGIDVNVATPKVVEEQLLEARLETPTVVDRALSELGDAAGERRAAALLRDLDAAADGRDASAAAVVAYELGELYERRLADEARAVKAYGRALALDPSLRANLWAIRRVFYRRSLWPNLAKLIAAEVAYARDDAERADLYVERAWVAERLGEDAEARAALEEAVRCAPHHQGALLELERVAARAGDTPALLATWERLAEAAEHPVRKIAYWLEVGRGAAGGDFARAREAFARAAELAGAGPAAERVARERLRAAEEHGDPQAIAAAIDALAGLLLAAFGPAGPADGVGEGDAPHRAHQLRRELVALRRRQAQLHRVDRPEQAWDVLQQALALAPGEPVVLADLTELAEELGRYDDLAELVQSWQAVEGDPGRAMVLSIRRADALLRGGQREQARALLASLEATAPGFIVLTSAAERDAIGRGDAGDLARAYLAAAQAALLGSWLGPGQPPVPDAHAAAALYVQAAELLAYEVAPQGGAAPAAGSDPLDDARAALGKALEAVPGYPPALEALTELDDATGNVAEALARLRAQAEAARTRGDGAARRAAIERGIRLARSHGDLESVLGLERELVELAPGELALRWRLEGTLAQLGRDEERASLLTELAAGERDPLRRGTALVAAARLRERAGAVEAATELYRQVLALWPDDTFARESLTDLLRAQERWVELVSERRAEARALPDGPAARRALREAAWVLEVRLGDAASAALVYDEWLRRLGEDRAALEGLARCRAQFGDRAGEVEARRAIAELEPSAESQWLLARAHERAVQLDDAADLHRLLMVREDASVAATSAAFSLADLAAGRADTVMRIEAAAALAGRTTEPRLGAALAEDSGWMYALVLEDFERAAQSFAAAIALDPTRRGALLGAALVAARQNDPGALAAAYEGLAGSVAMPEAAAALHLRAAAVGAAIGDVDVANARVTAARAAAPDDTSALLVLAETAPTPVVEASDPEAAVDPLLARAEVLEMRGALADDPVSRASWDLDRAEALELAGRLREAGAVVVSVLRAQPGELRALEALRRMAERAGDRPTWGRASYELARAVGDPAAQLALLRDASSVLDERGAAPAATPAGAEALAIYRRILAVDPGAPELPRMLELLRQRANVRGLIAALTDRLSWLEAEAQDIARDQQMVPLLLERATVLHGLGDQAAAMADLDALLDRAASHAEALRFRADLAFEAGEVDTAVALWRRCISAEARPQRRAEVELQLAKVLAENVNDLAGAIENLERVVAAQPEDIALRERLLTLCLRASDWERAARELERLVQLRAMPQERARDELRLGLMLRDRAGDPGRARAALERARALDPLSLEVVRELVDLLDGPARAQVLAATAASLRVTIAGAPRTAALYDRLAQVAAWQSDVDGRWLALVALEALGTPTVDQRQVLEQGRLLLGVPGRVRLEPAQRHVVRGAAVGALVELWRAIAPAVQVSTGVDAGKLGFGRGDRIPLKRVAERYEPLAGALHAFGVEDVEVYVSASRLGVAWGLAAETPVLCLGGDVAAAKTPAQRWQLGRAVAMLAEGFVTLPDLREAELVWAIAAALRAAEAPLPAGLADEIAGEDSKIDERVRVIRKELSRRARGAVQQLAQQRGGELVDIPGLRRAALAVGSRAGLLWCGDLGVTLAQLDLGRGGKAISDHPAALELIAWSISEEHQRLREQLGVALRGGRA
jgi:tetratricopeptide (TPR) repeat protein